MNEPVERNTLIWSAPLRVFHWLFAGTTMAAIALALVAGEHSTLFAWHMLFGLNAAFLPILRLALGLSGERHASLSELFSAPFRALAYLRALWGGGPERHAGHNPLAAVAYLAMFVMVALLAITGINMNNEFAEEAHEVIAYALIATIALHLLGIALHTLRHRENIALSMLDGRKNAPLEAATPKHRYLLGGITLAIAGIFMGKLFSSYDQASGSATLPFTSIRLALGENDGHEGREREPHRRHERDDHHEHEHEDEDDD